MLSFSLELSAILVGRRGFFLIWPGQVRILATIPSCTAPHETFLATRLHKVACRNCTIKTGPELVESSKKSFKIVNP